MAQVEHHVSPYAGSWYPGEAAELEQLIARLFAASEQRTGSFIAPAPLGFVVPHAGLQYSGTVAAAAWRHIRAAGPERVVIIGFSHRGGPPGCWLPDASGYRTPIGDIAIDRESVERLAGTGAFSITQEAALCDHSVEIQLPFLAYAAPRAKCVPVYVSRLAPDERRTAARALASLAREGAALVASSDFTHYGRAFNFTPFPADEWAGSRIRELDESAIEAAGSLRSGMFIDAVCASRATVCGVEPIALLLDAISELEDGGEVFAETLDYQTSGEITGDYAHSVSYAALGFFPFRSFEIGCEDGALLLESARATLARYLETGERVPVPARCTAGTDRRATAFVTLHAGGELRGCVGRKPAGQPLAKTVPELTLSAALDDSRFEPVAPGEADLDIEISVLTPLKLVPGREAFRVNEHGALLEAGYCRGLLLPQVATERKWTAQQFFEALARKSGAPASVYDSRETKLSVFRAQIIR
jgi:AmmeMemoRadiSam system protein B/AmmeMemoRadiSam system protein A